MSYKKIFTVPDYYPKFCCKCGDCRSTCCNGWSISVSMPEYFSLLGRSCSPELRRRLDTAFHLAEHPTPEHYALVSPRFDGHCRLQAEDGYCMLQRECGEDAVTSVCRYYPRSPKLTPLCECSTSASCERTLELLFADNRPLGFVEVELSFELEEPPASHFPAERYRELREAAFGQLADRSLPLGERLYRLGVRLFAEDGLTEFTAHQSPALNAEEILPGLAEEISKSSPTMRELLPVLNSFCGSCADTSVLDRKIPDLEIKLEKLFTNHLFYTGFPISFESSPRHLADEYAALAASYAIAKLAAAAHMTLNDGEAAFIDILAQAFRVIEQSNFDHHSALYLHRLGLRSPTDLRVLTNF